MAAARPASRCGWRRRRPGAILIADPACVTGSEWADVGFGFDAGESIHERLIHDWLGTLLLEGEEPSGAD